MQTHTFLCLLVKNLHENMHVSMYFLHLVLTFTPHYIIMVKGLSIKAQLVLLVSAERLTTKAFISYNTHYVCTAALMLIRSMSAARTSLYTIV